MIIPLLPLPCLFVHLHPLKEIFLLTWLNHLQPPLILLQDERIAMFEQNLIQMLRVPVYQMVIIHKTHDVLRWHTPAWALNLLQLLLLLEPLILFNNLLPSPFGPGHNKILFSLAKNRVGERLFILITQKIGDVVFVLALLFKLGALVGVCLLQRFEKIVFLVYFFR